MNGIVGFTVLAGLTPDVRARALRRQGEALASFPTLSRQTFEVGPARLELWGRGELAPRIHQAPDGSLLAVIGSPQGPVLWTDVPESVRTGRKELNELPWEGRAALLRISADGQRWTMCNSWAGTLPVFYAAVGDGRLVSTLEPVVASLVAPAAEDIFLPNLMSLLINGHTVGETTLLKQVHLVPPDSFMTWSADGFHARSLRTVAPSEDRAGAGWNEIVDEMYERSRQAIADTVRGAPRWVLPLSSGLDSRLIASVVASLRAEVRAFAWGSSNTVDFFYSARIAQALGIPWRGVELPTEYLTRYTQQWANLFGSPLHFHGMYQMAFLDAIATEPQAPILTGFLGDVLSARPLFSEAGSRHQLYDQWLTHWTPAEVRRLMRFRVDDALHEMEGLFEQQRSTYGETFKGMLMAEIWSRQRLYTSFQSTLSEYWRGIGAPFLNRQYARFCLSLPRAALDGRRALADVYRRHYPRVAQIPGTYGEDPLIRTGTFLLKRHLARAVPRPLLRGPLREFRTSDPRMDLACVRAHGWDALWPLQEARRTLADWMDVSMIDEAFAAVVASDDDVRPLRKLQSVQAFAYLLLRG
jgi:Asparagine synthase